MLALPGQRLEMVLSTHAHAYCAVQASDAQPKERAVTAAAAAANAAAALGQLAVALAGQAGPATAGAPAQPKADLGLEPNEQCEANQQIAGS